MDESYVERDETRNYVFFFFFCNTAKNYVYILSSLLISLFEKVWFEEYLNRKQI